MMERRVKGNFHARCEAGENLEIISKDYLSLKVSTLINVYQGWHTCKSLAGWNDEWGSLKLVTSPGSSTTGTYQPFGMDCSGFVSWSYDTAGFGNVLSGGTSSQWTKSYPINQSELKPGDLVFKKTPNSQGINHIGLFYKRENGKKLYIHCAGGVGVVVNSYSDFKYWRRAYVKFKDN